MKLYFKKINGIFPSHAEFSSWSQMSLYKEVYDRSKTDPSG